MLEWIEVLTVPVQCVHAGKILLAALTGVRSNIEVQLLVPLAIVLPCKALATPGPLALVRFLLRMRAQVTCACPPRRAQAEQTRRPHVGRIRGKEANPVSDPSSPPHYTTKKRTLQVEVPSKRTSTPRHWTRKVGGLLPSFRTRLRRARSRNMGARNGNRHTVASRHVDLQDTLSS